MLRERLAGGTGILESVVPFPKMNSNPPASPTGPPSNCPTDMVWQRLLREELEPAGTPDLAAHLEACSICRARLDALAGLDAVVPAAFAAEPPKPDSAALRAVLEQTSRREFLVRSTDSEPEPVADREILLPAQRPETLGRFAGYDVVKRIASGGMGVVYQAWDPALNRMVALKILAPVLAASDTARARFLREGRATASVAHDHVVAIHAVGEDRGLPYLVMALVSGVSLERRLQNGPLELTEILRIGRQIALGLAAAHAQGLIHRDVKPGNILLENGIERVKLTDFGLARAVDSPGVTRPGTIAGTPEYMSPEQARGEPVDARSDLFSLGSVLYACATGVSPFAADSTPATLKRVCDHEPPPLSQIRPTMPIWLGQLIARLMVKGPAQRWGDAEEVARCLADCLVQLEAARGDAAAVNPPFLPSAQRDHRRYPKIGWAVLGFAVVAALIFGGWYFSRKGSVDPAAPVQLLRTGARPLGFAQVADAIERSGPAGGVIELAFDGPREMGPVQIGAQGLTLRAAAGRRPVVVGAAAGTSWIRSDGPLVLEDLELRTVAADADSTALADPDLWQQRMAPEQRRERIQASDQFPAIVQVRAGNFVARRCRFVVGLGEGTPPDAVLLTGSPRAEFWGCEFYALGNVAIRWRSGGREKTNSANAAAPAVLWVTNCLFFAGRPLALLSGNDDDRVTLTQSTFIAGALLTTSARTLPNVSADHNVFVVRALFDPRSGLNASPGPRWQEQQNIFSNPLRTNSTREWFARKPGPQSRLVQLGFHERMREMSARPRPMTPMDFRITDDDAAGTDLSGDQLRLLGCQPATVGPRTPSEKKPH